MAGKQVVGAGDFVHCLAAIKETNRFFDDPSHEDRCRRQLLFSSCMQSRSKQ